MKLGYHQTVKWLETEEYDVVLTDISMPGLSGVELLAVIRQRQPRTPVIVISGLTDREHARGLMSIGAFDYIAKPFRLESVEKSVKRTRAPSSSAGRRAATHGRVVTLPVSEPSSHARAPAARRPPPRRDL